MRAWVVSCDPGGFRRGELAAENSPPSRLTSGWLVPWEAAYPGGGALPFAFPGPAALLPPFALFAFTCFSFQDFQIKPDLAGGKNFVGIEYCIIKHTAWK